MNTITISAVGDVMVGGLLSSNIDKYKDTFLTEEVRKSLSADIVFCNLECPLCNLEGPPKRLKTSIHAKEESIIYLKSAGFNLVSLANNHTTDFGWSSLKETIEILEKNNVYHVGAGKNLDDARKPVILKVKGLKIAFLAYFTDIFSIGSTVEEGVVFATKDSYGVSPYNPYSINEDIEKLKSDTDYIIVSMHWQDEFIHYPTPRVISEARRIIDMGADIIIGHNPHVLQSYEEYHNSLIFYSLSNFLFSPWFVTNDGRWINYEGKGELRRWYPECREAVILKCSLSRNKKQANYELIPTIQDKIEPIVKVPPKKAGNKIMKKMKKWSLACQNLIYIEDYKKLIRKEDRFKFFKELKNMIGTYGLSYTIKRGKNRFLRGIK